MPAKFVARPQRAFEVDAPAGLPAPSVVLDSVSFETSTVNSAPLRLWHDPRHREAHAVAADRGAGVDRPSADSDVRIVKRAAGVLDNLADIGDETGEHILVILPSLVARR